METLALAHYQQVAQIAREGENRLIIFAKQQSNLPVNLYHLEEEAPYFDEQSQPYHFIPTIKPAQQTNTVFGDQIELLGYDLPTSPLHPGESLPLNLYWQAQQSLTTNYRVFVHLVQKSQLLSQQDDDPACRLPTSVWRKGQTSIGHFRLAIPENAMPGRYALVVGLYQADTQERLIISAGAGQAGDDFLWLGDIDLIN